MLLFSVLYFVIVGSVFGLVLCGLCLVCGLQGWLFCCWFGVVFLSVLCIDVCLFVCYFVVCFYVGLQYLLLDLKVFVFGLVFVSLCLCFIAY